MIAAGLIISLIAWAWIICAFLIAILSDRKAPKLRARPPSVMRVDRTTAYICAWCEREHSGTHWANANGYMASHGICPMHMQQQVSSIHK